MDSLPAATYVARALLALARTSATGVLTARGAVSTQRARIAVVEGTPRAVWIAGPGVAPLGDLLGREGAFDAGAHARALEAGAPDGPIGQWLVRRAVTSEAAVSHALRKQLRARVSALFSWEAVELRFVPGSPEVGVPQIAEPVRAADLVLGGLRTAVEPVPLARVRAQLGDGVLRLAPLGELLAREAALHPEEAAMLPALRSGASVAEVLRVAGGSARALRGLRAFTLVHAATPPRPGSGAYTTLLRKTRQLRSTRDPGALLELPRGARPEQARRALRRLARDLHPDRFGASSDPAIRKASNDVLSALVHAEAELNGARRRGPHR